MIFDGEKFTYELVFILVLFINFQSFFKDNFTALVIGQGDLDTGRLVFLSDSVLWTCLGYFLMDGTTLCRNLPYDGRAGEKQKCVFQKENAWKSPPTFI